MPYLQKKSNGTIEIQYRNPATGQRKSKSYPPGTKPIILEAVLADLDARIKKHKAGIEEFVEPWQNTDRSDHINLGQFAETILADDNRNRKITSGHLTRNKLAMRIFVDVLGPQMPISKVAQHIEQFKSNRYYYLKQKYERKGKEKSHDDLTRGVNTELRNLRLLFRYGVEIGLIPEAYLPNFKMDRTSAATIEVYTENEVFLLEQHFRKQGFDDWLMFMLFRYTGARRSSLVRRHGGATNGLRWKHIDWFQGEGSGEITFFQRKNAKRPQFNIPILKELRRALLDAKSKQIRFDREKHVLPFVASTVSHKFHAASKALGINKPRPVHCTRHTAATRFIEAGWPLPLIMEWFGWSSIETAMKYIHISKAELHKRAKEVSL